MGSLTLADGTLPFLSETQYRQACSIIGRVIERLGQLGRRFTGIMNSGFFATAGGVKVIEFNARFGDPECMNIMSLFDGSWPELMERLAAGSLRAQDVRLREEASVVLYLVSPEYALGRPPAGPATDGAYDFTLERERIEAAGCHVFFSSAVATGPGSYRTVGTSRAVALASTAPTLEQARVRVAACAATVPVLEWRRDVGDERSLEGLRRLVAGAEPSREGADAAGHGASAETMLLPNAG
jgi:phosphoribosylamine--glycine ligase